jgi:hypothetical protein
MDTVIQLEEVKVDLIGISFKLSFPKDEASRLTPGPFDLVFVTWGTICWLPDLAVWAGVIASVLAPGGELYLADAHPSFLIMEERGGKLEPTYDFQTPVDRPLEFKDRDDVHRRSHRDNKSSDTRMDTPAIGDIGSANRGRTNDRDVPRT